MRTTPAGCNVSVPDRLPTGPDPSRADDLLLPLLAAGATAASAAAVAGVSERTVRRRVRDEDFRLALQRERGALRRQLVDRLVVAALAAVDHLGALAEPGNIDATRLSAAKTTLEFSARHLAVVDLNDRIAELEERAEALSHGRRR